MRVLVYGFKPYDHWPENITEKMIRQWEGRKRWQMRVFPIEFEREMFREAVEQAQPEMVLGMGQYPRGKMLRIERKGVNLMKKRTMKRAIPISPGGPDQRLVNWRWSKGADSWISYNAGTYLCNFSMYVMMEMALERGFKFAFLHLPHDFKIERAMEFVEAEIGT